MSTKIEALNKILKLTRSGNRTPFHYRLFDYRKDKECYCALGCLLNDDELDELYQTGNMTLNISSSEKPFQSIRLKLCSLGFTDIELHDIQLKNDKMNDKEFEDFILGKIKKEESML